MDSEIAEFICSKGNYNIIYNLIFKYVNKVYDRSLYHLDNITQSDITTFRNFHIEKLFDGMDMQNIISYIHSFVLVVNNIRDSSMVTYDGKKLGMLNMDCFVRFFIIEVKKNCDINVPNIKNIFPDDNNIESININPIYNVIMDRKMIINVDIDKLSNYYIFIRWILEDIYKNENNQNVYYYGYVTSRPKYLDHDYAITYDKIKHVYLDINCNNSKQQRTNDELRNSNHELIKRLEILEREADNRKKSGN